MAPESIQTRRTDGALERADSRTSIRSYQRVRAAISLRASRGYGSLALCVSIEFAWE